nr:hypothetical protein [Tanacetum cinerariifolium]
MVDIILEDLRYKAYNKPEVAKEVVVILSCDEDRSTNKEIMLMGDGSFSDTDDDDTAKEQPQAASTSRRYRKIFMAGRVLFLISLNAPVDQCGIFMHKEEIQVLEIKLSQVGNVV